MSGFTNAQVPGVEGASLCFSLEPAAAGGSRITRGTVRVPSPQESGRLSGCASYEMQKAGSMLRRVHGVCAVLEIKDLRALAGATLRRAPGLLPDEHAERLFEIVLCDTAERRRVDVVLCPDGSLWAQFQDRSADGHDAKIREALNRDKFYDLCEKWSWYGGEFPPASTNAEEKAGTPDTRSTAFELPHPYLPARSTLDRETLGDRFLRGRTAQINPVDRVLEIEKLLIRVPAHYTPREPAGLLVWVDAGDEGEPPAALFSVLDQSNMVIASFAKCGNTRPIANRYQLTLDAVSTATRRFHIDRRRVYIAGISGGGRVASIMAACFPEVFSGAIPIVGLNCPEPVPIGGGRYTPPAYARPSPRVWEQFRRHRMAPITGGRDFNQAEIIAAAQVLRTDGVPIKVFEYLDLGHELPSADRFAEALAWVDEPWQKQRKTELENADRELRSALIKAGIDRTAVEASAALDAKMRAKLGNPQVRAGLMRVMEAGPWSPAAWTALQLVQQSGAVAGPTSPEGPETPSKPDP